MIQHGRWPLHRWDGKAWASTGTLAGRDRDRGPGEVGAMTKKGATRIGAVPVALVADKPPQ